MASFKRHISFGALIATVGLVFAYFYAIVTDPLLLGLLFLSTLVGALLPDIDSDSSVPFRIVWGLITLYVGGIALLYVLQKDADVYRLIGIPTFVLIFMWFMVGGMFQKWTRHRGIIHSLPVMCIVGLLTLLIAKQFHASDLIAIYFGLAVSVGFLTHLVLDELYATTNFDNSSFLPKKSLGTALKLFSSSLLVTFAVYILLATLVYMTLPMLELLQTLWNSF